MSGQKRTINTLSYGLSYPSQLFEKLERDADLLSPNPSPDMVFNFIITAAVLAEWISKHYKTNKSSTPFVLGKDKEEWVLPDMCESWIADTTCVPRLTGTITYHIKNMLSICTYTANASKHFHWKDSGLIDYIGDQPKISNWHQYFSASRNQDLYVTYCGENYGLQQIKGTLLQFYRGLIEHFEHIAQHKTI